MLKSNEIEILVRGQVAAGWPSPAEEELSDTMSLDEYLIKNKEATYMIKVKGDSMQEAGIMPGDIVLVERGAEFGDGSIVVAQIDEQWVMRYFRKRGGKIFLEAANKKYKPIFPAQTLKIDAVVKGVVRKY
jgi:repressor LexA